MTLTIRSHSLAQTLGASLKPPKDNQPYILAELHAGGPDLFWPIVPELITLPSVSIQRGRM